MKCPFLTEERIKFCRVAPYRKNITLKAADTAHEACSSSAHRACALARESLRDTPAEATSDHCPFLQDALALYCSASSVAKFVPYSDSEWSKCSRSAHRYCDLYLTVSNPELTAGTNTETEAPVTDLPQHLSYSDNHLWLDMDEPGHCHIGIDAFMARLLGKVEQVRFLTFKGVCRPTVVLTVRGVDLPVVFPNPVEVLSVNVYLRGRPERIASDPYTFGWLFEAKEAPSGPPPDTGLRKGTEAASWLEEERRRVSVFAHERAHDEQLGGAPTLADGGEFSPDLLEHLSRDGILCFFSEFFSPYKTSGGSSSATPH